MRSRTKMSLNKYVHSFTKVWINKRTLLTSEVAPKEPRQHITEFNLLIIPQIFAKHFLCVRYSSTDWGCNSEQKEPSKSLTWGIFTPEPLKHSLPISSRNRGINVTLFFCKDRGSHHKLSSPVLLPLGNMTLGKKIFNISDFRGLNMEIYGLNLSNSI